MGKERADHIAGERARLQGPWVLPVVLGPADERDAWRSRLGFDGALLGAVFLVVRCTTSTPPL